MIIHNPYSDTILLYGHCIAFRQTLRGLNSLYARSPSTELLMQKIVEYKSLHYRWLLKVPVLLFVAMTLRNLLIINR